MHRDVQTTCLVELETPWKRKLRFHFQTKPLRYPQLSIRGKQYAFFSLSESEKKFSLALTPGVSHSLSLSLSLAGLYQPRLTLSITRRCCAVWRLRTASETRRWSGSLLTCTVAFSVFNPVQRHRVLQFFDTASHKAPSSALYYFFCTRLI
jgi:hypothetical protein